MLCQPDAAAVAEVDVEGGAREEEFALCFFYAAHGELAQAGAFLEAGESALGDGRAVAVEVRALPGGEVVVHLVAGVVVVAVRAVGPGSFQFPVPISRSGPGSLMFARLK